MKKRKKLTKRQRAKLIERGLRLIWDSLESHLPWTYGKNKGRGKGTGTRKFHKGATGEYGELVDIFTQLY